MKILWNDMDDSFWIGGFSFQELIHIDWIMLSYILAVEKRIEELPEVSQRRTGLKATLSTAQGIHEIIQEGIYTRREVISK